MEISNLLNGKDTMSGYITFWSKDYVKQLNKNGDAGPFKVVYGSPHTRMPSISSLRVGDVVYAVALQQGTLCIMARLQIEKIEPAFDYMMREMGQPYSSLIPKGIAVKSQGPYGEFAIFAGGSGYLDKVELPEDIHTIYVEEELTPIPHLFHQEPITCCAELAASGSNGSTIAMRPIPLEIVPTLLFGKTKSTQKPLKLDKNGCPTSISLSGFIRKMSDETLEVFEEIFQRR